MRTAIFAIVLLGAVPFAAQSAASQADELRALREQLALQQRQLEQQQRMLEELSRRLEAMQAPPSAAAPEPNVPVAWPPEPPTTTQRLEALERDTGRFRWSGDVRARYEGFLQDTAPARHHARFRLRVGAEGRLGQDFHSGFSFASGTLNDPISTNQTLTDFFTRKPVAIDRAWVRYQPRAHPWLQLTAGKWAYTWDRTPLTFDSDLNPEGLSQKLSFDVAAGALRNVSITGMQLFFNELGAAPDSFAAGGQVSTEWRFGERVTLKPGFTVLNWRHTDAIARAQAAGQLIGQPNTNATIVVDGQPAFASQFLYADTSVELGVQTGHERWPLRLVFNHVKNPRAVSKHDQGVFVEAAMGRLRARNDVQFGYTFARVEQDAIIAAFGESDFRAATNVLQHRVFLNWTMQENVSANYSLWIGRTLDPALPNAQAPRNFPAGAIEPWLKRMQLDLNYRF